MGSPCSQRGSVPSPRLRRHSREGGNPARSLREAQRKNTAYATHPFRLWASHFLRFAKKSNQKKATPTIVPGLRRGRLLSCDAQKKAERKKPASLRQFFVLIALIFPPLGANQRGPIEPIFDRFAMKITKTRMRASGPSPLATTNAARL